MKDITSIESDTEMVLQVISPYLDIMGEEEKDQFLKASLLSWAATDPDRIMMPTNWKMPTM